MVERKVRHALVHWTHRVDDRDVQEIALRGAIIELPAQEAERLDALGATIPVDAELGRPGTLQRLSEDPSDEEIISWVMSATTEEVTELAVNRPILIPRMRGALDRVHNLRARQTEVLSEALRSVDVRLPDIPSGPAEGESAMMTDLSSNAQGTDGAPEANDAGTQTDQGGDGNLADDALKSPDEVVAGDVESVKDYLSRFPQRGAEILEAENRRTEELRRRGGTDADAQPRKGVVRAVQATAGFTQ